MKKLFITLTLLLLASSVFAFDVQKNDEYYRNQIGSYRIQYSNLGLMQAVQQKKTDVLKLFMEAGFDPNYEFMGIPMSMYALYKKDTDTFDVLLKHGANPEATAPACGVSTKPQNLLSFAIKRKISNAVKSLIDSKVDVNKSFNGKTPLNYAIQTKQTKIVELLLNAGAKPDDKTWKLVDKSKDEYLKDLFAGIER